jgi:hypothetical protein
VGQGVGAEQVAAGATVATGAAAGASTAAVGVAAAQAVIKTPTRTNAAINNKLFVRCIYILLKLCFDQKFLQMEGLFGVYGSKSPPLPMVGFHVDFNVFLI